MMKNLKKKGLVLLGILLLTLPVISIGCTNSNELAVTDAAGARDAVLDYLDKKYDENIPGQNLSWLEEDKTPSGLIGLVIKSYTSTEWAMEVSYPVVKPDLTVYTVTLINNNTGWKWQGNVSANGTITETRPLQQITQEESQQIAENFVKNSPTFKFDGMGDTLKFVGTVTLRTPFAWQFTFEFQSRHGGYGDRTGQNLTQVITPHTAVITVIRTQVTMATLDGKWNMLEQKMIPGDIEVEISLAPIHNVEVYFMESFPVQVGINIKGGLRDGCTTFHDAVVTRVDNIVNIEVTVQKPKGMTCPAVYTIFEEYLNLGSDFIPGTTYTLTVNDYKTTFVYY